MVLVRQDLVSSSMYYCKCPYEMTPKYITVHNTANDASAANEVKYMKSNTSKVSFHVAVDDKEIVQCIPFKRNAFHAGDGSGNGNRKSIGVEICYSKSGGKRFDSAEKNAAEFIAYLMHVYNIPISKVVTHKSWSGKNCPHRTLALGWERFKKMVQNSYNSMSISPSTSSSSAGSTNSSSPVSIKSGYTVKILVDQLNVRKGASTSYDTTGVTCKKGEIYTIISRKGDWGKLKSGAGWINVSSKYCKRSTSEKVVQIIVDELNVRDGASISHKVVGTVKKNYVYCISETKGNWGKLKSGEGWINIKPSYCKSL